MSYLFFDIEAANRHEEVAKIYSFGYVLTDIKFNIIEKDEIIINPDAEYYFTIDGKNVKIDCPIDLEVMSQAQLFPEYYDRIKQLLTSNICIGYGTVIDAHMLHESCKRYNLPSIRFKFYDVIEISDSIIGERIPGLNKLSEHLGLTNENPHNGLADAITTYKVCKKLLEDNKKDIGNMRYKKEIFMYQTKEYKVFRLRNNRQEVVPKRKFKDMKIQDVQTRENENEISENGEDIGSCALRDQLEKWLKQK